MPDQIKSDGKAVKTRATFRMDCTVSNRIHARPDKIWGLLTDAANYTKWNSTLNSLEGNIALGGTVQMKVPEAPGRTFKVKVSEFVPNKMMVWRDGFCADVSRGTHLRVKPELGWHDYFHDGGNL